MPEERTDRTAAVANALLQIEKQFGKGSIMKLGGREKIEVQSIPTGSISLDAALGVGGFPKGRVIEVHSNQSGDESDERTVAPDPLLTFRLSISRPSTDSLTGSAWQSRVRHPVLTSLYSF